MPTAPVRQTVILAAGAGTRLGPAGVGDPKPLVTVGGVPLIGHALRHAHASGCTEAIVVIGHEGQRVRAAVESMRAIGAIDVPLAVRFIENPDPDTPNGRSLLVAETVRRRAVLSADGRSPVHRSRPAAAVGRSLRCADRRPCARRSCAGGPGSGRRDEGSTRGRSRDGDRQERRTLGRHRRRMLRAHARGVRRAARACRAGEPLTVSSAMRQLAARGALAATELTGIGWVDVDTPADRDRAERRFAATDSGLEPVARGSKLRTCFSSSSPEPRAPSPEPRTLNPEP